MAENSNSQHFKGGILAAALITIIIGGVIITGSASSTSPVLPLNHAYTASKSCTLFGNQGQDYCFIPWPAGFTGAKNVTFYGKPVQSGELIGRYNDYQREWFGNTSIIIPSAQTEFPNNSTEFRLNQTAVIQIGMTVHFRTNSTGFCEQTVAKMILQNTTATPLGAGDSWSNMVAVPLDCSTGTTLWASPNNPFASVPQSCNFNINNGLGAFDCFTNATRILTTTWGNNACTAGFDQKRCPEQSFNGQFFRFILVSGDGKTQIQIYSIDLTITSPVTGRTDLFAGQGPQGQPEFQIELLWVTRTSLVDSSTVVTMSVVTSCTSLTTSLC